MISVEAVPDYLTKPQANSIRLFCSLFPK